VLGLGVGAFSTDPRCEAVPFGVRRANTRDLPRYLEAALAGSPAEEEPPEVLDAPTARGEAVFLALRSAAGLDAQRFASEFGRPPRGFWEEAIVGLIARGLLQERLGGDLKLTRRGRLLSNSVFEHFV
jgi:coproporphyrinogen III oxidase-like Fe-S oxidoreductase